VFEDGWISFAHSSYDKVSIEMWKEDHKNCTKIGWHYSWYIEISKTLGIGKFANLYETNIAHMEDYCNSMEIFREIGKEE
jgi:hypothetical protein